MDRRKIITSVGSAVSIAGLAGCSSIVGTDETAMPTDTNQPTPTKSPTQTEAKGLKQPAWDNYQRGYRASIDAAKELRAAVEAKENGDLEEVQNHASSANTEFENGYELFEEARALAGEEANPEFAEEATKAINFCRHTGEASRELRKSAIDQQNGDTEKANEHLEKHRAAYDRGQEYGGFADPAEAADLLGL